MADFTGSGVVAGIAYAVRTARRSPGFYALAVVITACGIGAAATIFSLVSPFLLRPMPYSMPTGSVTCGNALPSTASIGTRTNISAAGQQAGFGEGRDDQRVFVASG